MTWKLKRHSGEVGRGRKSLVHRLGYNDYRLYILVGIQSFNMGCNSTFEGERLPNILTLVPPLVDWITDNSASGIFCSRDMLTTTKQPKGQSSLSELFGKFQQMEGKDDNRREIIRNTTLRNVQPLVSRERNCPTLWQPTVSSSSTLVTNVRLRL